MSQPLKKQQIISLFGDAAGTRLLNWLDPCCEVFCLDIKRCLGISEFGDPSLILNQQGNFISMSGGGVPAAPDQSIQFNNSGSFGGSSNLSWDGNNFKVGSNRFTTSLSGDTQINAPGQEVRLGDLNAIANSTQLVVSDSSSLIALKATGSITIGNFAGQNCIDVTPSSKVIVIGDVGSSSNSTKLLIDDTAKKVEIKADGRFLLSDVVGNAWVDADIIGNNFYLGQSALISRLGTTTKYLEINSLGNEVSAVSGIFESKVSAGGRVFLRVDNANFAAAIGDINVSQNGTYINIDDTSQIYTFSKLGGSGNQVVTVNNVGELGTTTLAALTAGTYTPVLTAVTNISASAAKQCSYSRVGSVVTVFGSLDVTTTLAVATEIDISLPIASNLGIASDANGLGSATSAIATNAYIDADAVNNRVRLKFIGLAIGGAGTIFFSFNYNVI